jgi:uncharacterized membrane protein YphA (DoxX/SURF4 family)
MLFLAVAFTTLLYPGDPYSHSVFLESLLPDTYGGFGESQIHVQNSMLAVMYLLLICLSVPTWSFRCGKSIGDFWRFFLLLPCVLLIFLYFIGLQMACSYEGFGWTAFPIMALELAYAVLLPLGRFLKTLSALVVPTLLVVAFFWNHPNHTDPNVIQALAYLFMIAALVVSHVLQRNKVLLGEDV